MDRVGPLCLRESDRVPIARAPDYTWLVGAA